MPEQEMQSRVTRIEQHIDAGFKRLEDLVLREIADLKTDQIARLDKALDRLGDDQRRLWESCGKLADRMNRYGGGVSALHYAALALGPLVGAAIVQLGRLLPH